MNEFLSMSGYGAYIWTSYLAGLIIVVWNVWTPLQARRRALRGAAQRARDARR